MAGGLVFAGIVPHPPLLVPEIGGDRIRQVADSQQSLRRLSSKLIDAQPQTVVVISPHSPLDSTAFTARSTPHLSGDFREFYARHVQLTFQNDLEFLDALIRSSRSEGVELRKHQREYPLDHGALVPLYYLREAGWQGPIVVIGFTLQSNMEHLAFGRAIAAAALLSGRRVALLASGDLSHRLIVGGPYEYEPTAHLFDEQIVDAIATGNSRNVIDIDQELRERAGECGYRSIVIALGSIGDNLSNPLVLSYEGPFGVGYMVAILLDRAAHA